MDNVTANVTTVLAQTVVEAASAESETGSLRKYNYFIAEFMARYAIDFCGATETFDVAFLSLACILSYIVWMVLQLLIMWRVEVYLLMTSVSLTALSVLEISLLLIVNDPPPVAGCGFDWAWPSPQTAFAGFVGTLFLCYDRDFGKQSDRQYVGKQSTYHYILCVGMMVLSIHSALFLGFSTAPGALAGACVGTAVAAIQHEMGWTLAQHSVIDDSVKTLLRLFAFRLRPVNPMNTLLVLQEENKATEKEMRVPATTFTKNLP